MDGTTEPRNLRGGPLSKGTVDHGTRTLVLALVGALSAAGCGAGGTGAPATPAVAAGPRASTTPANRRVAEGWSCLDAMPSLAETPNTPTDGLSATTVDELGQAWDRVREQAGWDPAAPEVLAFAEAAVPWLIRHLHHTRRTQQVEEAAAAVRLLSDLGVRASLPALRAVLEDPDCPSAMRGRAGLGLARIDDDGARRVLSAAFVASVREGRAPEPRAWKLCEAAQRAFEVPPEGLTEALERLFTFAPHAAMARCSRLVVRLPSAPDWRATCSMRERWTTARGQRPSRARTRVRSRSSGAWDAGPR